jgi:hypothetical protein
MLQSVVQASKCSIECYVLCVRHAPRMLILNALESSNSTTTVLSHVRINTKLQSYKLYCIDTLLTHCYSLLARAQQKDTAASPAPATKPKPAASSGAVAAEMMSKVRAALGSPSAPAFVPGSAAAGATGATTAATATGAASTAARTASPPRAGATATAPAAVSGAAAGTAAVPNGKSPAKKGSVATEPSAISSGTADTEVRNARIHHYHYHLLPLRTDYCY